jgi:hypothetical protein
MNAARLLAFVPALVLALGTTVWAAARDPLVHVVIHVMLAKPQALAGTGGHWYCEPGRPHTVVPTPEALLRSYEHELRSDGIVTDHFGFGTWTVGSSPSAGTAFMEGDHVDVLTHLSTARRFLAPFLHRLRIDLDQREALGEIFGGAYGTAAQARTRILVTLPSVRADYATLVRIHRIFGDAGRGGATQIADEGGVHIYTGTTVRSRPRIEAALRAAGFAYTEEPETFVTDDAPPCPRATTATT